MFALLYACAAPVNALFLAFGCFFAFGALGPYLALLIAVPVLLALVVLQVIAGLLLGAGSARGRRMAIVLTGASGLAIVLGSLIAAGHGGPAMPSATTVGRAVALPLAWHAAVAAYLLLPARHGGRWNRVRGTGGSRPPGRQ